ncbi:hypothetical protein GCK32_013623, partial [Trichostrongylus colubriformis]
TLLQEQLVIQPLVSSHSNDNLNSSRNHGLQQSFAST